MAIRTGWEDIDVGPIVQQENFPKPTGRMVEILEVYREARGLNLHKKDDLSSIKVVSEIKTRDFNELSQEDRKKVLARIEGVDYLKSACIQNFARNRENPMTKHAEIIISKYAATDISPISDPIIDLIASLKSNNLRDVIKKVSSIEHEKDFGFFSSIRDVIALKNAKKKIVRALIQQESLLENIRQIESELKKQQISLRKDIAVYEEMGRDIYTQVSDFELDIIALDLMISDAEAKLKMLTDKGTIDFMELSEAKNLKSAIDRMNRRKNTIQTVRLSVVQSISQLEVLIYGDEIICEKIDEIYSLVIPLWTWQYAIAAGAVKQQEALSIQKTIRGITSKLLTGNAKILHDNMTSAQKELYSAVIAIEDLCTVQEYIDVMVEKVNAVRKESSKKCAEGMKKIKAAEQKNKELMAERTGTDS